MSQSPSRLWIRNPLGIFTANDLDAGGGLVVSDGKIVELVPSGGQPSSPATVFDASGHVVLPGLINTHTHAGIRYLLQPVSDVRRPDCGCSYVRTQTHQSRIRARARS